MKSADFSNMFLNTSKTTIAVASLLVFYSLSASADAPSPETFNQPSELVLTLSDHWLQADKQASLKTQNTSDADRVIADKLKKAPVKVDCGMDVNQNTGLDNSLGSRLTGECDLHYNY